MPLVGGGATGGEDGGGVLNTREPWKARIAPNYDDTGDTQTHTEKRQGRQTHLVHLVPSALPLVKKILRSRPHYHWNAAPTAQKPVQEALRRQLRPAIVSRKHPDPASIHD